MLVKRYATLVSSVRECISAARAAYEVWYDQKLGGQVDEAMDHMREWTRYRRDPALGNLELLHATFVTHVYAPHAHEGFAIGVIEAGAERFRYRHDEHVASAGQVVLVNPGEMHTGQAARDGWSYRMLYPATELLQHAAEQLTGSPQPIPFFGAPVVDDPALAAQLSGLHAVLEMTTDPLEREMRLLTVFTALVARHADARPAVQRVGDEPLAVVQARRFLDEHAAERPTLSQLAAHVGLSPFHLLRVFQRTIGSTPHAYLTHLRVRRARHLLANGAPPADVALEVGFADQSHLTRAFRRIVGVPPAQFAQQRKIVQD